MSSTKYADEVYFLLLGGRLTSVLSRRLRHLGTFTLTTQPRFLESHGQTLVTMVRKSQRHRYLKRLCARALAKLVFSTGQERWTLECPRQERFLSVILAGMTDSEPLHSEASGV
jgi:hypothetical protein